MMEDCFWVVLNNEDNTMEELKKEGLYFSLKEIDHVIYSIIRLLD